jgi:hypothetical protein
MLHALYAWLVGTPAQSGTPDGRTRFEGLAGAYVADAGPHADLVNEWLRVVRGGR